MSSKQTTVPDNTAVRVALWRALHVQADDAPHVLVDEIGLKLVAPEDGWQLRPDMDPQRMKLFRASIVSRARYIEDLVLDQACQGVGQYVLLGAGLDSFAQRRPEVASGLKVFEVDEPASQAWKRRRLMELGFGVPEWLRLVPINFETGDSWLERIITAGFDASERAIVASTGVSMYLTKDTIMSTLQQVAKLAPGSTFLMTFLLPIDLMDPDVRPGFEMAAKGAAASGTPFFSFFAPEEMLAMAREAGFRQAQHISSSDLAQRYFSGRTDGLRPPDNAEELLIATT